MTSFTNVPWTDPATPYNNNYGAALDIFALGVNVSCATTTGDDTYGLFSGTSVSAGLVAGAAVQWINKLPTKTSVEIKDIILQEGHLLGMNVLTFDEGSTISTSNVNRSVLTVALAGQITLGNLPSGRILNVQLGQSATKDLELNLANGEDFSIKSQSTPASSVTSVSLSSDFIVLSYNSQKIRDGIDAGQFQLTLKNDVRQFLREN